MSAKFIKMENEWFVEVTVESTGTKMVAVGDIITVNRKPVKVTKILEVTGEAGVRGTKSIVEFVNYKF